ncbi:MAG: 4-hydroxy-3-methylbut-2-enyl diphosphate reductase [Lachnospiraceae bacterium]|nr:4-hydroxy-3-methylbut-2-enyl diphosphate reductase [Lachnospiraceae bacterium]
MEVKLAKTAGFCFGVKRAVETVYKEAEKNNETIYTFGPIIHNEQVVEDLEKNGVFVVNSVEELKKLQPGTTVIVRSHGVGKAIYDLMEACGLHIVDATCPFVKKIHRIVERESNAGKSIIIIGNDKHPEVEGIKGWVCGKVSVIENFDEARAFRAEANEQLCIVSQTTFNYNKFQDLVEIICEKGYDVESINTICNATEERQTEAKLIAGTVDGMIVIGGSHSSNTQKLFEICKKECENTHYIQTLEDLDIDSLKSCECIGITAGASTPNNIIEEVQKHVRIKF